MCSLCFFAAVSFAPLRPGWRRTRRRRPCVHVSRPGIHVPSIHIRARRRIRVDRRVCIWSIDVSRSIRIAVCIPVAVCVCVRVFVCVPGPRTSPPVVAVRGVCIATFRWFVRRYGFRSLTFFGRPADVHGHSLTCLDHLAGTRQLKHDGVAFCLISGPGGTNAKLQVCFRENLLSFKTVLANDIGNCRFGTAQRQVDSGGNSEEKNNRDRDHDGDTSENGRDSGS